MQLAYGSLIPFPPTRSAFRRVSGLKLKGGHDPSVRLLRSMVHSGQSALCVVTISGNLESEKVILCFRLGACILQIIAVFREKDEWSW
jgi:hypothetical protein